MLDRPEDGVGGHLLLDLPGAETDKRHLLPGVKGDGRRRGLRRCVQDVVRDVGSRATLIVALLSDEGSGAIQVHHLRGRGEVSLQEAVEQ